MISIFTKIGTIAGVLILTLGSSAHASNEQLSSAIQVSPLIVTTEQLRLDFIDNTIAAERKYSGKILNVFGEMRSLRRDPHKGIIIVFTGVEATLEPGMEREASTYRQGQNLQLICTLELDNSVFLQLHNCKSPNHENEPVTDQNSSLKVTSKQANNTTPPLFLVSAAQYYADYEANDVAADLRYKDKTLTVIGIVRLVGKNNEGKYYVSLHADTQDFADIDASLLPEMANEAATYRPGQQIQLICIGGARFGQIGTVGLRDCKSP